MFEFVALLEKTRERAIYMARQTEADDENLRACLSMNGVLLHANSTLQRPIALPLRPVRCPLWVAYLWTTHQATMLNLCSIHARSLGLSVRFMPLELLSVRTTPPVVHVYTVMYHAEQPFLTEKGLIVPKTRVVRNMADESSDRYTRSCFRMPLTALRRMAHLSMPPYSPKRVTRS